MLHALALLVLAISVATACFYADAALASRREEQERQERRRAMTERMFGNHGRGA